MNAYSILKDDKKRREYDAQNQNHEFFKKSSRESPNAKWGGPLYMSNGKMASLVLLGGGILGSFLAVPLVIYRRDNVVKENAEIYF